MCGILGVYNLNGNPIDEASFIKMGDQLIHRGPDGEGCFINSEIGLIHKRLSILDTSEKGKQPMYSKNKKWIVVFNGCIYNFKELRIELEKLGHVFESDSDTEVIAEGLSAHGTTFFERFNGMFAIGAWNVEEKKVETKAQVKKEPKKDEASAIKSQEIQAASNLLEYLLPKKVQKYDDSIIDKVSKQISEMKVANNLEKDKISKLRSIDTLEKLTEEFLRFKNITSVQLSTLGGGGSTNILDNDDVDISSIGNGKILEYNSTTGKMQFVSSGSEVTNLEVLGTIIFEGATADDFETTVSVVDPTADRTITLPNASGAIPVLAAASNTQITATPEELNHVDGVTGNIQTALDTKATKAFAIAQAVALG